jgi:hypothetical protein
LLTGAARSSELPIKTNLGLEPTLNGGVSANGLFPTQAMQEEFSAYLDWTKDQGLSRLVAFESVIAGEDVAGARLRSQRMEDQFVAYMIWVQEYELSPFYAFAVTNFD